MENTCKSCAWYCHADGKCYGNLFLPNGFEVGAKLTFPAEKGRCKDWQFDGLEDWEREETETLMTVEMA